MAQQKTSEFYWACRNGDEETVKKLVSRLKSNDINQIESNGSTALHAASYYGHANIVRILLQYGANTKIYNKYNKTPIQEASTGEIRTLFERTNDNDDDIPKSEFYQVYPNTDGTNKSALATRVFIVWLGAHQTHKYTMATNSNIDELEIRIREICRNENHLNHILHYFQLFRKTRDFSHLLQLYTTDSSSFRAVCDDNTFRIEMYNNLLCYDKQRVKGRLYRDGRISPKDLNLFRWALNHHHCLLETTKFFSTTLQHNNTICLMSNEDAFERCLLQFDLPQQTCFTVIDISQFNVFQGETEVLIVPGTFFSVTEMKKTDDNITIITLINVPVDESSIKNKLKQFFKT